MRLPAVRWSLQAVLKTLCGREDELSSFEHAANSTAAQSAGNAPYSFFTTKHFPFPSGASLCLLYVRQEQNISYFRMFCANFTKRK